MSIKCKTQKNRILLLMPVLITVLALATKMVRFIVNDDIGMMRIAESYATNARSEHLIFMNVVYGYLLKALYHFFGSVNWFVLLELFVLNIAFIALFYIVLHFRAGAVGVAALCCAELFFLANFTFTSIAFVCALAGMLWMLTFVRELKQENIKHIVISVILFSLGFLMRSGGTYLLTVAHCIPVMAFAWLKKRNKASVIALMLVLCTVCSFTASGINKNYQENIPDETYFNEFNEYRFEATDGGAFNYTLHSKELKEAGITRIDYRLLSHWTFADRNVFTGDTMKAVADSRDFNEKYQLSVPKLLKAFFELEKLPALVLALLIFSVLILLFAKRCRWEALCSALFTCGGIGYLFFRRRALERVTDGVILCGFILLLYIVISAYPDLTKRIASKIKLKVPKKNAVIASLCALMVVATCAFNVYHLSVFKARGNAISDVLEYMEENDDVIYLSDPYCFDKYLDNTVSDHILKPYVFDTVKVYTMLGGWYIYSDYYYDYMERIGLGKYSDSAISALLDENVYYITKKFPADTFVTYFKQHYKKKVAYDVIKEYPDKNIVIYNYYEIP